jgi:predicted CXXCH cytochrome family protein
MSRRTHLVVALAVALTAGGATSSRLAPLPAEQAVTTHSPFEMGDCQVCHARRDRTDPGPVENKPPQLCLDCHDDFVGVKRGHPSRGICTRCHSPHNSKKPKLLL